jgi:hypothetical protein
MFSGVEGNSEMSLEGFGIVRRCVEGFGIVCTLPDVVILNEGMLFCSI